MTNVSELPFFQVDAFAPEPLTGNPAAVMPLEAWLPDATLQAIAAENNLSETAFTVPSSNDAADYDLRWFTPTVEVEMCGHATIASAHVLLRGATIRFATRSGILTVSQGAEPGLLCLDLPASPVAPGQAPDVLRMLGVEGPVYLGSSANGAVIVLLDREAEVRSARPDFAALRATAALVIITAPGDQTAIASRVFAGYHGIDEDPVTGSAHSALVPLWAELLARTRFSAAQVGPRGGLLDCELVGDRVLLSGRCRTVIEGRFRL